jgi:hypothetical protein
VAFEVDAGGIVTLWKATEEPGLQGDRFTRLMGRATAGLTTDEIMAMARGED